MKVIGQIDTEDIVHELCHLKIHNHRPAFYRPAAVAGCLPQSKEAADLVMMRQAAACMARQKSISDGSSIGGGFGVLAVVTFRLTVPSFR